MVKSYTDLEQSKKLAEILPLESADMLIGNYVGKSGIVDGTNIHYYTKGETLSAPQIIYAWSLATLLNILRAVSENSVELYYTVGNKWAMECYTLNQKCVADEPVDACVGMIEKLHEQNLL